MKKIPFWTWIWVFPFWIFFPSPGFSQGGPPPAPVEVEPVQKRALIRPVSLVGTVEPRTRSLVASEVAGLVEFFPIEEGMSLKRGDLLAALRTDTLRLQLKAAEASKQEAQARFQQAQYDLERSKKLFEEKVIPEKQLQDDQAEADAWNQKVRQFTAERDQLKDQIEKSRILAPFDGEVVQTHTEIGQWLKQGDPVAEIIELNRVRIKVDLPEKHIKNIKKGDPVTVTVNALPGRQFSGKIFSITPQADSESRTFPVKVELENKNRELKSGLMTRVSIPVGPEVQAKTVPKDALVIRGGNYLVYVIQSGENGSTVAPVSVQAGLMSEEYVEIDGNIEVGQQVVVRGNERLRPGQAVQVGP